MKVLNSLKLNKSSDSSGLIYELFRPNVGGADLFKSVLTMVNKIKNVLKVPKFIEEMTITSIYKNKGSKLDINNER